MAIAVDKNYDKAQRKISTANLKQFAGVDCQLLVEKETHRPIIMDGATIGGKFKCASVAELKTVETVANKAISQAYADERYLSKLGGTMTGAIKFKGSGQIGTSGSAGNYGLTLFGSENDFNRTLLTLSAEKINPRFELQVGNGTTRKRLIGKVDGTLQWDTKEVERVDSSGTTWIRFDSGLQICFGEYTNTLSDGTKTIVFPKPFNNAPMVASSSSSVENVRINSITSTKFESSVDVSNTMYIRYIAIGYWK